MEYQDLKYQAFIKILRNELKPAMGCTEPIAIAYCAAKLREVLGHIPDEIVAYVSGNIIKNVKSVKVPHTNGMQGIEAAIGIGIVAGDASKELEVISYVTNEQVEYLPSYLKNSSIKVKHSNSEHTLYIELIGRYKNDIVTVAIRDNHLNICLIIKNDEIIYQNDKLIEYEDENVDTTLLSVKEIVEFANIVKIEDVKKVLDRQIKYNMAIAEEGLKNNYGANIGKTILKYVGDDVLQKAKALAAAGSDARMNGCDMPVVINSGSGNQGITTSVPVITFARHLNKTDEELYRALVVANLCTIHMKTNIGKLSAYCGVITAGAGCGAGIAYLEDGSIEAVSHTLVNCLAINSGVVCDGAKSSCAAKIASAVEAGILGYFMYKEGNEFYGGDGLVKKGVENTIKAIGELAKKGMCTTDKEIIHIMIDEE